MMSRLGAAWLGGLLAAAAASLLPGCADGPVAGSEIGNPTIAGTIVYPDGKPAAGAAVVLRRKDYLALGIGEGLIRTSVEPEIWLAKRGLFKAETETDAQGRFAIDSVDTGEYRIEVLDRQARGLVVDVSVGAEDRKIDLPVDTALATAAINGTLKTLDPTAGQYLAYVRGLERAVLVDEATGAFSLPSCPAGTYTVHFGCLDAGCLEKDIPGVEVKTGEAKVMDTVLLQTFATEKYSAWKHSMKITLNTTASGAGVEEDVDGFPMLVRLDSANFPFAGADGQGRDIRFADLLGNNLHLEIERWDSAGKRAEVWVRIPTVKANSDSQVVTLYWGNPLAPAYSSGVEVFPRSEGFRAVWHLAEGGGTADNGYRDASANSNHGTGANLPSTPVGLVGPGQAFSSALHSSIKADPDSSLHSDSALTLELWANFTSVGAFRRLVGKAFSAGRYPWTEYDIESDAEGRRFAFAVGLRDSLFSVKSDRQIKAGEWVHVSGTYDGTTLKIYLDGILEGALERKGVIDDHGQGVVLGKYEHDGASNFNGSLDEVRITGKARSAAWIRLSFENQRPGSSFLGFSPPTP